MYDRAAREHPLVELTDGQAGPGASCVLVKSRFCARRWAPVTDEPFSTLAFVDLTGEFGTEQALPRASCMCTDDVLCYSRLFSIRRTVYVEHDASRRRPSGRLRIADGCADITTGLASSKKLINDCVRTGCSYSCPAASGQEKTNIDTVSLAARLGSILHRTPLWKAGVREDDSIRRARQTLSCSGRPGVPCTLIRRSKIAKLCQ